ncbi:MAG TPA: hypothetical protein VK425_06125 [Acidimicrobiales bacterium]|nr:hypothetical protein [Acidimicrobiales bacterium]
MGQERLVPAETDALGNERWQQPQLLALAAKALDRVSEGGTGQRPAPERRSPERRGDGPGMGATERRRQAGLVGIAEARAALAEAARRAQARAGQKEPEAA